MIICKLRQLMLDILAYLTLLFIRDKVSANVVDFIGTAPTRVFIMCDNIHEWNSLVKSLKITYPKRRVLEFLKAGKSILSSGRKPVIEIDEFGLCNYTSSKDVTGHYKDYVYYDKFKLYTYKRLCLWKNS